MAERTIAFILLAAGRSERFGGDKLIAPFKGKPLWRWAADAAQGAGFDTYLRVIGLHSSLGDAPGWQDVVNVDAAQGMGTSIAAGVRAARQHDRIVIGLADMPMMSADHLERIASGTGSTFTRYADGSCGCPAGFARKSFAELQTLTGDRGARSLDLPDPSFIAPENPGLLFDVDMREDLRLDRQAPAT